MRSREVGRIAARRSGRGPQSERTVAAAGCPGWEMFPVGSRTAVVQLLGLLVERTVTAIQDGSGDGEDGGGDGGGVAVAVGEGDGAAS